MELAYSRAGRRVTPVRSNFEYAAAAATDATPLFKLHGCVTQDLIDGHNSRLVLTETDYDEYASYRQVVFQRLGLDSVSMDVLVIGQSLRDRHLRDQLKLAHELHEAQGAPGGRLMALIYDSDPDRLELQRRRGFIAAGGSLDELVYALTQAHPPPGSPPEDTLTEDAHRLRMKPLLSVAAVDVDQGLARDPEVERMFTGVACDVRGYQGGSDLSACSRETHRAQSGGRQAVRHSSRCSGCRKDDTCSTAPCGVAWSRLLLLGARE